MIRVDRNDIPTIVQSWSYGPARTLEVDLFNGKSMRLCLDAVRNYSVPGYLNWNADSDQEAIDAYADRFFYLFAETTEIHVYEKKDARR